MHLVIMKLKVKKDDKYLISYSHKCSQFFFSLSLFKKRAISKDKMALDYNCLELRMSVHKPRVCIYIWIPLWLTRNHWIYTLHNHSSAMINNSNNKTCSNQNSIWNMLRIDIKCDNYFFNISQEENILFQIKFFFYVMWII